MAFGKISVVSRKKGLAQPKQEARVRQSPPVQEKGSARMEILLIASTVEEAGDFLCGLYFDLVQAVSGSQVTAYTREFPTINWLSETKQSLEEMIAKPADREFIRQAGADEQPLEQCTVTLGQAGNPALALDAHITVATPGMAGGHQADVVFALLNCGEDRQRAESCMRAARSAAGGKPVIWILSNFEGQSLFWAEQEDAAPKVQLRAMLRQQMALSCENWEFAAYSQIYGGLEFARREQEKAVLRTHYRCREYMPVGCHVPVFAAVEALRRFRTSQDENAPPDAALEKLWVLLKPLYASVHGWYDSHGNGGSGT